MATTNTATKTGILLPCPRCGEAEATIRLDLGDMDACTCVDCDGEFTIAEVRELVAKWGRVLAWIDAAPRGK